MFPFPGARACNLLFAWLGSLYAASHADLDNRALYPMRVGTKTFILGQKSYGEYGYQTAFLGLYGQGGIDTTETDTAQFSRLSVLAQSPVGDSAALIAGGKQFPGYGNDALWLRRIDDRGKTTLARDFGMTYGIGDVSVHEKNGVIDLLARAWFIDDLYQPVPGGTWHYRLDGKGKVLDSAMLLPGDTVRIHGFSEYRGGYLLWGRRITNLGSGLSGSGETSESLLMRCDADWRPLATRTFDFGAREQIDHVRLGPGGTMLFGQAWDADGRGALISAPLDSGLEAGPVRRHAVKGYEPLSISYSESEGLVRAHIVSWHATFDFDMFRYDSTGFYDLAFSPDGSVATAKHFSVNKEPGQTPPFAELGPDRWLFLGATGTYFEVSGGVPISLGIRKPWTGPAPGVSMRSFFGFDLLGRRAPQGPGPIRRIR